MDSVSVLKNEKAILLKRVSALDSAIKVLGGGKPAKRHLSAAARKKMSEAGRKRWADKKKQG
jgi:hypothetical protein